MTDLADIECQSPQGCLAYGIYFYREPSEYTAIGGEYTDVVREVVPSDRDGLEVVWVFSEELCAQDVCSYCEVWSISDGQDEDAPDGIDDLERELRQKACPGVWEHAKHALARNQVKFPWYDMEIGVFLVPSDLSVQGVMAEVLRQIRTGVTYAVAS
ncbi:hypothetical protein UK23_23845 [Lentzea aerocolonigenes]|uniref:Uncharacterized protein n=1 Tax=Lentzea aerocolonigenes TaxID=68170 RepID=A0A0F0GUU1_LENAE|nr:hypothetical protein [Lentzea aerocolonigenes]KJK46351.1 hypothetical protein UK23_23845 [Lentzea aerocolonigenes]